MPSTTIVHGLEPRRDFEPRDVGVASPVIPIARIFLTIVIARCAKRTVAIQLDCFGATLLAMTV